MLASCGPELQFRVWGLGVQWFRGEGSRGLGFRGLGVRGLGCLGFGGLGFGVEG